MKDTWWLIRKILMTTFKDYRNWLLFIVLPLVAVLFAIFTQGSSVQPKIKIAITDYDGQFITRDTIDYIASMDSVVLQEVEPKDINDQIVGGELDASIVFSSGFTESLKANQPVSLQIAARSDSEAAGYIKLNVNHYIDNLSVIAELAAGDDNKFMALYNAAISDSFPLISEKVEDQSTDHRKTIQTIGYLVVIMLFSAANLAGIIIKEREIRTFYRIIAAPIKMSSYVLSNIVVNMVVMVVQIVLSLLILTQIFNISTGISFSVMLLALLIFAFVAVSFSFVIVAFTRNKMEANGLQPLLIIPTSVLAGCMFPIEMMPSYMEKISFFLPQYWLLDTFSELQNGNGFGSIYINLMILLAFSLTFVLVAILRFGRVNASTSHI